jgi:acetyl-CoA C-acetyltransferase
MIETADNLARDYQISREACDEYAAMSHQRAAAAWAAGKFDDEVVPVAVPQKRGDRSCSSKDEGVRPDATAESLGKLRRSRRAAWSPPATPASRTTPPRPAWWSPRTSWPS